MSKLIYYTDGGCRNNQSSDKSKVIGAWAVVPVIDDQCSYYLTDYKIATTNNKMELTAILKAVQDAVHVYDSDPHLRAIEIYSDSIYSINTITQWAPKWKKNNTLTEHANWELINDILELVADLKSSGILVDFYKVAGHSGDKWNEKADAILNKTMDKASNPTSSSPCFGLKVVGISNFDEQSRIQCAIQDTLMKLGYECNSSNFIVKFE